MAVIKNINPVTEILREAGVVPRLSDKGANKKEALLEILDQRGVGLAQVADAIESQLYSSDETVKGKAIDRMLELTDIKKREEASNAPQFSIIIQGYNQDNKIQSILIPRES